MSAEPYVPNEQEIIEGSFVSEDEARRGIAKIRAEAWAEGYRQGIEDERTANEVQMGVGPNRNNPYRIGEEA